MTFAIAAATFAGLRIPSEEQGDATLGATQTTVRGVLRTYFAELKGGFAYLKSGLISRMMMSSVLASAMLGSVLAVLPSLADSRGGAKIYGLILASQATGMLGGSLLASYLTRFPVGRVVITVLPIGGLAWIGAALTNNSVGTILMVGLGWVPIGVYNTVVMSALLRVAPCNAAGRIISTSSSLTMVAMALGSLMGGTVARSLGPVSPIAATGVSFALVGLVWLFYGDLRTMPQVEFVETPAGQQLPV